MFFRRKSNGTRDKTSIPEGGDMVASGAPSCQPKLKDASIMMPAYVPLFHLIEKKLHFSYSFGCLTFCLDCTGSNPLVDDATPISIS